MLSSVPLSFRGAKYTKKPLLKIPPEKAERQAAPFLLYPEHIYLAAVNTHLEEDWQEGEAPRAGWRHCVILLEERADTALSAKWVLCQQAGDYDSAQRAWALPDPPAPTTLPPTPQPSVQGHHHMGCSARPLASHSRVSTSVWKPRGTARLSQN